VVTFINVRLTSLSFFSFVGDYIVKELEALYMLRKYRTLKRRYYEEEDELGKQFKNFDQKYVSQEK